MTGLLPKAEMLLKIPKRYHFYALKFPWSQKKVYLCSRFPENPVHPAT